MSQPKFRVGDKVQFTKTSLFALCTGKIVALPDSPHSYYGVLLDQGQRLPPTRTDASPWLASEQNILHAAPAPFYLGARIRAKPGAHQLWAGLVGTVVPAHPDWAGPYAIGVRFDEGQTFKNGDPVPPLFHPNEPWCLLTGDALLLDDDALIEETVREAQHEEELLRVWRMI